MKYKIIMKKPILTTLAVILLAAAGAKGQTKIDSLHSTLGTISDSTKSSFKSSGIPLSNIDFNQWTYSYASTTKYQDTLKCLFHEWSDTILLDKWTSGYIILKDGMLKTGHVNWSPDYAPMALGFFDNQFLYDNKRKVLNKVIQIIIQ